MTGQGPLMRPVPRPLEMKARMLLRCLAHGGRYLMMKMT